MIWLHLFISTFVYAAKNENILSQDLTPITDGLNNFENSSFFKGEPPRCSQESQETQFAQNIYKNSSKIRTELPGKVLQGVIPNSNPELRPTEVKILSSDSYDGPRTEDFINRLNSVAESVQDYLSRSAPKTSKPIQTEIENLRKEIQNQIKSTAQLDISLIQAELEEGKIDYFKKQTAKAKTLLRFFVTEVTKKIARFRQSSFNKKDLQKIENFYLEKQGRPNLVHIYEVDNRKFVSMHRPFNQKQGPFQTSAIRDKLGLANAVETSFFSVKSSGKLKPEITLYRHGSYPPIALTDPVVRRSIGMRNAELMLTQVVQDYRAANKNRCPKTVPMTTMMLLTPIKTDTLWRGPHGTESEIRQVQESYLSIRTLEGREIQVAGCTVVPEFISMNVGAKKMDQLLSRLHLVSSVQEGINAKGYENFNQAVQKYLVEMNSILEKNSQTQEISSQLGRLNTAYQEAEKPFQDQKNQIQQAEKEIRSHYQNLQTLQNQFLQGQGQVRDQILEAYKSIKQKEEKLQALYMKLHQQNLKTELPQKLEEDLLQNIAQKLKSIKNPATQDQLDRLRHIVRSYSDARKIYSSGKTHSKEAKLEFQKNFIIANQKMGRNVEVFCKSAKDRTGRMNNKIEEFFISDLEGKSTAKDIAAKVYHGGTSRDAAGKNTGGVRGLRIDEDEDYGILSPLDRIMGDLGKGIY